MKPEERGCIKCSRLMSEHPTTPPACEFNPDKLLLCLDEVLPSDVGLIDDVVESITNLVCRSGCAQDTGKIDIALREGLANAIVHGNRSHPAKRIRVCVALQQDCGILIIVKDAGSGFDPATLPDPVLGENLLSPHGRGIYLICQCMDEVKLVFGKGVAIHMRRNPPRPEKQRC